GGLLDTVPQAVLPGDRDMPRQRRGPEHDREAVGRPPGTAGADAGVPGWRPGRPAPPRPRSEPAPGPPRTLGATFVRPCLRVCVRDRDDLVEAVQGGLQVVDLGLDAVALGAQHGALL